MGFFKRLFTWGKSEANSALESLEDPIKMADQGVKDLEQDLDKSIKALASVKASCITSKNELDKAMQDVKEYENKAMLLLKAAEVGKMSQDEADKLATQCLEKKSQIAQSLPVLQANYNKYQASVQKLESSVKSLKAQIDKWKNEAKMLKARAKVSEATANVNKQLAGIDSTDTIAMLERMKEKVNEQEALAESYLEISESTKDRDIDSAIAELGGSIQAQSDLAALKAKMNESKAISAPAAEAKAISSSSVSDLDLLKQQMAQQAAPAQEAERPMQQADESPIE